LQALLKDVGALNMSLNDERIFGPPGKSGDPEAIARLAQRTATCYRQLIEWKHSIRLAQTEVVFAEMVYEIGFAADSLLDRIEKYGPDFRKQLEFAASQPRNTPLKIDATLVNAAVTAGINEVTTRVQEASARLCDSSARGMLPTPDPAAGYIYILQNPSMGNLLKIGKTS